MTELNPPYVILVLFWFLRKPEKHQELTCSRGTLRGLLSDTSALYSSFSSATSDPLAVDKTL